MKNFKSIFFSVSILATIVACSNDDLSENLVQQPTKNNTGSTITTPDEQQTPAKRPNNVTLHFNNTFKNKTILLGRSVNVSKVGQSHRFNELKYIISNIRLVKKNGTEVAYYVNNLDKGAAIINQSNPSSLNYVLKNIPAGYYKQIKFGLGVKTKLNVLDQERFPKFYAKADSYEAKMMWYWGKGYRFTKIEGYYSDYNKKLSIHTGSTLVDGKLPSDPAYVQGVDGYREIVLNLPKQAVVGNYSPKINIKADFDKLLSGNANKITLISGHGTYSNATPNTHTADQMVRFLDNIGGNGTTDTKGMFSIESVKY